MKHWLLAIALVFAVSVSAFAADLTPEQKLKAENLRLRAEVVQLQAQLQQAQTQLAQAQLSTEGHELEDEFRKTLNADKDSVFDWSTMAFVKKDTARKP